MKKFGIIAAGLLIAIGAQADTISSTGKFVGIPSNFQSTVQSNGGLGTPFWNNWSVDGAHMNVGDILTGTSSGAGSTNYLGSNGAYLSTGGPGPDAPDFTFLQSAVTDQATLLFSDPTSNYPYPGVVVTEIGLYDVADPTQNVALFSGGTLNNYSNSQPVTVNTWANYGLFADVCGQNTDGSSYCNTYYSNSTLNQASDPNHEHFAIFQNPQNPTTYFIGFEGTRGVTWQEGYGDFSDVIFELQTTQNQTLDVSDNLPPAVTPEPATWSILGLGLAGLVVIRRFQASRV